MRTTLYFSYLTIQTPINKDQVFASQQKVANSSRVQGIPHRPSLPNNMSQYGLDHKTRDSDSAQFELAKSINESAVRNIILYL